jgi:glycerophosphoryl diester phosphodiesterase
MKIIKKVLLLLIFIGIVLTFLEVIPTAPEYKYENHWIRKEDERPLIVPHAGGKALYPENTIYAFEEMAKAGYDVFEVDLSLTADNELISSHDVTTERLTNVNLVIREESYEGKLINYNYALNFETIVDGQTVKPFANETDTQVLAKLVPATLEYLFKTYPNQKYILELKDTVDNSGPDTYKYAVKKLINLIETYNMQDQVIVASFDDTVTHYFNEESDGKIMTSPASKETMKFIIMNLLRVDFFYSPKDGAFMLPIEDKIYPDQRKIIEKLPSFLKKEIAVYDEAKDEYYTNIAKESIVKEAHRHNMAVMYWTVNEEAEMRRLIKMGVDGIITDRPDLLKQILDEIYN